jgi:hypothetical protein
MEKATENGVPRQRRSQSNLSRKLLHKFAQHGQECPDNRSLMGMHERITRQQMPICARLVCLGAWPYGGRICVWQRQ